MWESKQLGEGNYARVRGCICERERGCERERERLGARKGV